MSLKARFRAFCAVDCLGAEVPVVDLLSPFRYRRLMLPALQRRRRAAANESIHAVFWRA